MKYSSKVYRKFVFTHIFFRYLLIDRILNKKDNIVLITGRRGSGKTTLSIKQILGFADIKENEEYYNKEKNINLLDSEKTKYSLNEFTPFDMEKYICFGKKELQDLWKQESMAFILGDEAIVSANRRNAMTKANRMLTEIATISRKNYNTLFLCMPSVEDFDLAILQYITHWIHIDDRGLAAVLLPNPPGIFGRKAWDIPKMTKVYDKFLEDNPSAPAVPYWLFSNFRGYIKFSALSKKIEDRYLEIAHMKKNGEIDEQEEKEYRTKRVEIPEDKKIKLTEISNKLLSGEISNSEEYYNNSIGLEFSKDKFNKEINKILFSKDGRNFIKVLRDNKQKIKAKTESEDLEWVY